VWVERVRQPDWRDAFVFFKHEEEGKGPQMARRFLELQNEEGRRQKAEGSDLGKAGGLK
jgi:uncharacterized protein YecE (DUF72 family)